MCDTYIRKEMENISDILIKIFILLGLPLVVFIVAYIFDKIFDRPLGNSVIKVYYKEK